MSLLDKLQSINNINQQDQLIPNQTDSIYMDHPLKKSEEQLKQKYFNNLLLVIPEERDLLSAEKNVLHELASNIGLEASEIEKMIQNRFNLMEDEINANFLSIKQYKLEALFIFDAILIQNSSNLIEEKQSQLLTIISQILNFTTYKLSKLIKFAEAIQNKDSGAIISCIHFIPEQLFSYLTDYCVQNLVGTMYDKYKTYDKAEYWYKKAAKQDYVEAQFNLGKIYLDGKVKTSRQYTEAFNWLGKAAE